MSGGPVYPPAAFTQAYRAYTPEHGADPSRSIQKADEVQAQTAGFKSTLYESDTVTISTAAAQLLADETRRRHSVQAMSRPSSDEAAASSTAVAKSGSQITSEQASQTTVTEVTDETSRDNP